MPCSPLHVSVSVRNTQISGNLSLLSLGHGSAVQRAALPRLPMRGAIEQRARACIKHAALSLATLGLTLGTGWCYNAACDAASGNPQHCRAAHRAGLPRRVARCFVGVHTKLQTMLHIMWRITLREHAATQPPAPRFTPSPCSSIQLRRMRRCKNTAQNRVNNPTDVCSRYSAEAATQRKAKWSQHNCEHVSGQVTNACITSREDAAY